MPFFSNKEIFTAPADYKPARITPGGNCVAPQCCGKSMTDVGECSNGCCDDYRCSECGHKVRVEWPD